MIIKENIFV